MDRREHAIARFDEEQSVRKATAMVIGALEIWLLLGLTAVQAARRHCGFPHGLERGSSRWVLPKICVPAVIISSAAVVITLVVCVPMAYGLFKISGRTRLVVSFGVLAMRFIPYVVLALPLFLLYVNLALAGSRVGLPIAHLAIHIPSPPGC